MLSETTKSDVSLRNDPPASTTLCRVTFLRLKQAAKRLSRYGSSQRRRFQSVESARGGGAEMVEAPGRTSGTVRGWLVEDAHGPCRTGRRKRRGSIRRGCPPPGIWKKVAGQESARRVGRKATSTGVSIPPVMTDSIFEPSGRQRKMCDALVTSGGLPGPLVGLLARRPFAPVDPAVGPQVRAVEVVGAAGQGLPLEPLVPLSADAVAIARRSASRCSAAETIERAIEPHRPFGNITRSAKTVFAVVAAVAVGSRSAG